MWLFENLKARILKGIITWSEMGQQTTQAKEVYWRERRGWDQAIFDWFALSMRMQVILDSSFARPGLAPIWGGKKGEFRDWTKENSK